MDTYRVVSTIYGQYLMIEGIDEDGIQFVLFTKRFNARRYGENITAKEAA